MIETLQAVPPAVAFLFAALVALFGGRAAGTAAGVLAGGYVTWWTLSVPAGRYGSVTFLEFAVIPVAVDPASRVTGLAFGAFAIVAIGYLSATGGDRGHLTAALAYAGAALWSVFAGDWLGLFIGWELMALTSTVLVWLHGGDAVRIGFRYALVHAIGGTVLAAGLALHAATLGVDPTVFHHGEAISAGLPALAVGLGIGVNAAVFGVHVWLPDTYASPHVGTSVVLSAYTTKLAVYAAYRAFPDGNIVLAYVGGAMAVIGASYALAQKDARRLLAYHIQAQVGYILAGIGVGSSLGLAGAVAHLFNNVLFKGLLFMVAGLIVLRGGTGRLHEARTIGKRTPILAVAFLVAAASISGVPGTNGFVSKGMVLEAALEAGHEPLRWLLLAGAVGTFVSFCKFGYYAFRRGPGPVRDPTTISQRLVMVPVAVACVALGLWYGPFFSLLPASGEWSVPLYARGKLLETTLLLITGAVVFGLGRPVLGRLDGGVDVDAVRDPLVFETTKTAVAVVETTFRTAARIEQGARRHLLETLTDPAEQVTRWLPAKFARGYRTRQAEVASTIGFTASVRLRAIVLAGCLLVALVLGVTAR
ncbi:Na(+)/H(+) antiporter subunit D [Natronorubrum sp. JWXQ-INN-674]|uniref:Na(+)/H(+) antiporter subunit D n=1 Tax=Natronorubrum halalkaliphilum TaxID=2691917 RepID=A0A6B0VK57_9EURY|nr:proton-conducting transporter membrane subunit [Natronorubrum halalkaliphilum]MXV61918.1 Na(+)/H(+) antiporter subunit D [Natronorubrum halalkaliphilum]